MTLQAKLILCVCTFGRYQSNFYSGHATIYIEFSCWRSQIIFLFYFLFKIPPRFWRLFYLNFYLSALSPPYAIPRQSKDPNKLYLDSSVKNTESQLSLPRWIYSVECKRFAIFLFDKCGFFRGVYALKSGESKKLKQFEDGILPASSNCLPITTADILVGYSPGLLNLADNKWQYCLFRLFHHFFLKKLQQHKRNSLIKKYSLTIRN